MHFTLFVALCKKIEEFDCLEVLVLDLDNSYLTD